MQPFMGDDFLLGSETAKRLFHDHAAKMPIVDYHCHINPREIYENKTFTDLAEAWLGGDHYKWRLMRTCGVPEALVTGNVPGIEKFKAFAGILPRAIGNPVYHWAHLELQRYFDCHTPLNADTAQAIWDHCNQRLREDPQLRVRGIIEHSRVTNIVTTDDPVDSLEWHGKLREDDSFATKVLPAFRPDKAIHIEQQSFPSYMEALSQAAGIRVESFASLQRALSARMDHFAAFGCRASDHGVDAISYAPATETEVDAILRRALAGETPAPEEVQRFGYALLLFLGREYARRGWVMEIHLAAERNVNTEMRKRLGPDTGFDVISPRPSMNGLSALLDTLHAEGPLPKTLLFSLNPNDDAALNTLAGTFTQEGVPGKVQQGSAWWFNDSLTGMRRQMTSFANTGVLGNFIGMLTDSRSFLSYARHEYFRRILCALLGSWVESGEYPDDLPALGAMVEDISYHNTMRYFDYEGVIPCGH